MTRYLGFAIALLSISSAHAAEKTFERTFTVSPGGALIVDADSASVHVSGGGTNQVTVHMTARGSEEDLGNMKLEALQKDDGVSVVMQRGAKGSWFKWGSWNSEGQIEISVPKQYRIRVRTGGGSVELRDTIGTARLQTSGGDIVAKNVTGNVEARTSGGGILADTIRGDVDADTSGGDVRLLHVDGKISGHTSGGSVRCSLVGINRGISATSSGGDIELTLPAATTGNLEATTSGGDITSEIPVSTKESKEGRLKGALNGGGQPIDAHTSGGGIVVRAANDQ